MIMIILVEHTPGVGNWAVLQNFRIFLGDNKMSLRVKVEHSRIMLNLSFPSRNGSNKNPFATNFTNLSISFTII